MTLHEVPIAPMPLERFMPLLGDERASELQAASEQGTGAARTGARCGT